MGKKLQVKVKDKQVCQICKYWYIQSECCGYLCETGESRMFKAGKQRVRTGYCDKFEEGSRRAERKGAFRDGKLL